MNTIPTMKIFCSLSVVLLGLICASGPTYAQTETKASANAESSPAIESDPSPQVEAEIVEISLGEGQPTLRLIPLPRRSNIAPLTSHQEQPPYELSAVYMAETELSLAQHKALLSEESWKSYQELIKRNFGGGGKNNKWDNYNEAVQNGSPDYPAVAVPLNQMVEVTTKLSQIGLPPADYDPRLEKFVFRLPTKTEWQYAARAIDNPTELSGKMHFSSWPKFDQKINGLISDMLELLEKKSLDSTPYQDQSRFLQLIDEVYQHKQSKEGYELLGWILQKPDALGYEVNIAKRNEKAIKPTLSTANPWGFHRMFGNLAEWVTVQPTSDAGDRYWELLTRGKPSDLKKVFGDDFGLVMGGGFLDLRTYPGSWKVHSAAHGIGESLDQPISHDDIQQEDLLLDRSGGVRLVVSRALADDWFVTMRNDILLSGQGEPGPKLAAYQTVFKELCLSEHVPQNEQIVQHYLQIAGNPNGFPADQWSNYSNSLKTASERFAAPERIKVDIDDDTLSKLDSIFGDIGGATAKSPNKDSGPNNSSPKPVDVNYFDLLLEMDTLNE